MSKPPLSIGFNLPFSEAIRAAEERGTLLPDVYYGQLQGLARQKAFSIAGIAAIDQLQAVNDSLQAWMKNGGSFADWKKQSAVLNLNLPKHRLETIWRTNLQGNYMRGRAEQMLRNVELRPYWLYDAINDSRTRPNHLAMDGVIRRYDDPFWKTHFPPCGFNCRCNCLSLTEAQAHARSGFNAKNEGLGLNKVPTNEDGSLAQPDPGWDYHPYEDGLKAWKPEISRFQPKFRPAVEKVMAGVEGSAVDSVVDQKPHELINGATATLEDMKQRGERILDDLLSIKTPDSRDIFTMIKDRDATVLDMIKEGRDLSDQVIDWFRSTLLDKAKQVRSIGAVMPDTVQKKGKGVNLVKRAASKLPSDWIEHANSKDPLTVSVSQSRGFFSPSRWNQAKLHRERYLRTDDSSTVEHEFMHHIQDADSRLDALFLKEHANRTAKDAIEVIYSHVPKETGKPYAYVSRYQGREYSGWAAEVITMAFQGVIGEDGRANVLLRGMLTNDKDMLHLVLGTLFHYTP